MFFIDKGLFNKYNYSLCTLPYAIASFAKYFIFGVLGKICCFIYFWLFSKNYSFSDWQLLLMFMSMLFFYSQG